TESPGRLAATRSLRSGATDAYGSTRIKYSVFIRVDLWPRSEDSASRLNEILFECDEFLRHLGALLDRHFHLLPPDAVLDFQRRLGRQVPLEVVAEPAVVPLAAPGRLRVVRVVDPQHRVPLALDHEAHGVPRQVDRPLVHFFRVPVAGVAHLPLA